MSRQTWFGLVLLSSLLVVLGFLLPGRTDAPQGKKYALLVGVREYRRSTFPDLKYTENDVERLAEILTKSGFTVRVLTNKRGEKARTDAPTAANITRALEELTEDKGRRDTVLVALSGHGAAVEVDDPDGKGRPKTYPFFCPQDADLAKISYSTGRNRFLINVNDLFVQLGRCGAGVKLVLMDACRNEMKAEGSARSIADTTVNVPRGIGALFSCSAEEKAFESEKLKHGVFFHYVLEGLRGKAARDGAVTFDDLVSYVVGKVSDEVPALMGGGAKQTPDRIITYRGKSPVLARVGKDEPGKEPVVKEKLPKTVANSVGMKLVLIPAGKFKMGSPREETGRNTQDEEEHEVEFAKPFYLGTHEVTQKQFKDVMRYNPSFFAPDSKV